MQPKTNQEFQRIINNDLKERHSFFQLKYFLIGKEPTVQSKLWRCIRELKTRNTTIQSLNLEINEVNDDLELIDIESQEISSSSVKEEIKVISLRKVTRKKEHLLIRKEELKNRLKNIEEEVEYIISLYQTLEQYEPLKSFDDISAQKQYWEEKLGQDYNLRRLYGLPLDLEGIKTILALSADSNLKKEALEFIDIMQNKFANIATPEQKLLKE